jgi:hypothetical protein
MELMCAERVPGLASSVVAAAAVAFGGDWRFGTCMAGGEQQPVVATMVPVTS